MTPKPALPAPRATKPPIPLPVGQKFLPPWLTGVAGPVVGEERTVDTVAPYDFRHVHPNTQAIRRMFVAEYVKDFSGTAALARMGFEYKQPANTANAWLKEAYTQHILDKYIRASEDDALITRQQIISGLNREANNYGLDSSGASRVSALGKLGKIMGLEIDRSQLDVTIRGGIMLVPLAASPADWERNASRAQLELKAEASE